jgi:hypothetical protein
VTEKRITFARPTDRSLPAFKAWIEQINGFLGGQENASDARIEAAWRKFWGDAPEEPKAPCPT